MAAEGSVGAVLGSCAGPRDDAVLGERGAVGVPLTRDVRDGCRLGPGALGRGCVARNTWTFQALPCLSKVGNVRDLL